MTKKKSNNSNTAKPFSPLSQEEVTMVYENLPQINFKPPYIVIGATGEGKPIARINARLKGYDRDKAVGLLNGMMDRSVGTYPVVERGLHLKYSLKDLWASGYQPNAGYVCSNYDGDLAEYFVEPLKLGWWSIGFSAGQFVFEWPARYIGWVENEPQWVEKARHAHCKHVGLDLLAMGNPIIIEYSLNDAWFVAKVATKQAQAAMPMAERKADISARVANTRAFNDERRVEAVYARPDFVEPVHLASVRLWQGGNMLSTDMIGKTFQKRLGNIAVMAPITITEENLGRQLDSIRRSGITVELL